MQGISEEMEILLTEAKRFYKLALARDYALTANTLDTLNLNKNRRAVLVTGGFHTAGIKKLLKENNIGYVTLTPKVVNGVDEQTYIRRMMEVRYDFSKGEFSEKRIAARKAGKDGSSWTLAAAALWGNIFEAIADGQYDLENDQILTGLVDSLSFEQLNEQLNEWMQKGENREFIESLEKGSVERLLKVVSEVYPESVSGQIAQISRQNATQKQLAVSVFRRTYAAEYPGLVALVELYFSKPEHAAAVTTIEDDEGGFIAQG